MSLILKRLLFALYVFFVKTHTATIKNMGNDLPETFIWKDAWFFLWNKFFWSLGRKTIAPYIKTVKPLLYEEWSKEEIEDVTRFQELAQRDAGARDMHDKIFRTTRYVLAPDTAIALCRIYEHAMLSAPWQYGLDARLRSKKRLRNIFFLFLLLFVTLCSIATTPAPLLSWAIFYCFFAMLGSLSGWYASVRMYHIARETTRLRAKRNAPSL